MSNKILFVDDDVNLLSAFQRTLRKSFALEVAAGPREALELLNAAGPFAVIVADMRMPGMDGLTLLEHAAKVAPDTVRIMLTGNPDQSTTMGAINRGHVTRFLSKPCPPEVLVPVLQDALQQHLRTTTERAVLESTLTQCVQALAQVFGMTMPEAHERGECLRGLVRDFALAAGVGPVWELETAALLSPIGLAALPAEVTRKLFARVALEGDESAIARRVPKVGHDLLHNIPRMENIARIILYQDKNFDGSGFPEDGCKEDDIPIGARLLKIVRDRLDLEAEGKIGPTAQTIMTERFGIYDYRLLGPCFARFPALLRPRLDGEKAPRHLALSELEPGHHLYTDIVTTSGFVVAATGHQLTGILIERLTNLVELGEVREPFLICDEGMAPPVPTPP
jgi:response regulator RpfG family c-di-GMP phosphodiesterase